MVLAAKRPGFLHAENVNRSLNETYEAGVAPRVVADVTNGLFSQRAAELAKANPLARSQDSAGESFHGAGFGLDHVQGDAFGGTRADPRELA
jgi:hypothetical protein